MLTTLAVALLISALHLVGASSSFDQRLASRLAELRPQHSSSPAPVLITIDEDTINLLGPVPWGLETWRRVSHTLAGAGVLRADLLEPWPRVLSLDDHAAATDDPGAVLRAPQFDKQPVQALPAPFQPWRALLTLPSDPDGVIRDISRRSTPRWSGVPSTFCDWSKACPDAPRMALPIHNQAQKAVTQVPLAFLMGGGRLPTLADHPVLIGLTAAPFAHQVRLLTPENSTTWAEAVAAASTATAPTRRSWLDGRAGHTLLILLVALVSHVVVRRDDRMAGVTGLVLPALALTIALALWLAQFLTPPFLGVTLAALAPPAIVVLRDWRRAGELLQRASLSLEQAGAGPSTVQDLKSLTELLLRASAHHVPSNRVALLAPSADGPARWLGGHGLHPEQLDLEALASGAPLNSLALRSHTSVACAGLLRDRGQQGHLVSLRSQGQIVCWWVRLHYPGEPEADWSAVDQVAAWAERRLQLAPQDRQPQASISRDMHTLRVLADQAVHERRHRTDTLESLGLPLAVADISGGLLHRTASFEKLFSDGGFSLPDTARQIMALATQDHVLQVDALQAACATRQGKRLPIRLGAAGDHWLVVSGILGEADGALLGFVLRIQPLAPDVEALLHARRALQADEERVRALLHVGIGRLVQLESMSHDHKQLQLVQETVLNIQQASDQLRALITPEQASPP